MKRSMKFIVCLVLVLVTILGVSGMPAFAATQIDKVEVYLDKPVAGKPLDWGAYIPTNSKYERYPYTVSGGTINTGVSWYDDTDKKEITDTSAVAVKGHKYIAHVYVRAKDGYEFGNWNSLPTSFNGTSGTGVSVLTSASKKTLVAVASPVYTCADPTLSINSGAAKTYTYNSEVALNASYATADNIVFLNWTIRNADTGEAIATYTNPYQKIKVTGNMTATAGYQVGTVVKSVAVTGIDAPIPGNTPDYTATVASTEKYQVWTGCGFSGYHNGVRWYDDTDSKAMTPSDKFKAGHVYNVNVALVTKSKADFCNANNLAYTINGKAGTNAAYLFSGYSKLWYVGVSSEIDTAKASVKLYTADNTTSPFKSMNCYVGTSYNIEAPVKTGKVFNGWSVRAGQATIADPSSPKTTVTATSASEVKLLASYTDSKNVFNDLFNMTYVNGEDVGVNGTATGDALLNNTVAFYWDFPKAYEAQGYKPVAKLSINGIEKTVAPSGSFITGDVVRYLYMKNELTGEPNKTVTYKMSLYLRHPDGTAEYTPLQTNTVTVNYKDNGNIVWFNDTELYDGVDRSLGLNPTNITLVTGRDYNLNHYWDYSDNLHKDYKLQVLGYLYSPINDVYLYEKVDAGDQYVVSMDLKSNKNGEKHEGEIRIRVLRESTDGTVVLKVSNKYGFIFRDQVNAQIVKHPEDVRLPKDFTAKFTVEAIGDGLTYQWYAYENSKWVKKDATTATYSFKVTKDTQVYCNVTDKYNRVVQSNAATLTVAPAPKITTQPANMAGLSGDTVNTSITATGDGLTYQWYVKKGTDSPSKYGTTSKFTYVMDANSNGLKVYCVVTDKYGVSVTSDTVTLTLKKPLAITKQPESAAGFMNESVKVSVTATGDGLTYQWYKKDKTDNYFVKVSGATTASCSVSMTGAVNGRQLYCVVYDKYGNNKQTDTVTLTLKNKAVITTQPTNVTAKNGESVTVKVAATGDGLKYEWYYKNKGASNFERSSVSTASYSVTMSDTVNGRQLYCKVSDKYGNSVKSDTVTLTMGTVLKITKQPTNVTVANGIKFTVSVTANGDGLKYEWYYKNKGASNFERSSVSTASYSATMSDTVNGRQLYCKVSDKYGNSVKSDTVTLTMDNDTTTKTTTSTTKSTTKPTTATTKSTTSTTKSTTKPTTATTKSTTSTTKSTTKPTTATTKSTTSTTKSTTKPTTTKTTTSTTKPTTTPTQPNTNIEVIRLSGKGRCQTAVKISNEAFTKADNVVLASGDNYADALAGVPLAYKMNAPILLVQKHKLHADTLAEIQRLGAKNVYILGGAAAISDDVKTELESKGYHVERIKGKNRFATSLEIAKKLQELCGKPDEIFFAYSHNYPDALAVSGVAAAKGCPVVYVAKSGILDKDIAAFVKASGAKKGTIIGGTAAIGEAAEGDIAKYGVTNVTRLSGKNRYATCVKINEAYAGILTGKSICVATGTNFPDALAGGVFAAKTKSPLVLVGTSLANEHKSYLGGKDANKVYVFGGTGAVSDNVVNAIVAELKK